MLPRQPRAEQLLLWPEIVPVSQSEVDRWLLKVPMLPYESPHRSAYLRQWRVVEKIARAKQEGRLDALLGGPCAHCGQGLP